MEYQNLYSHANTGRCHARHRASRLIHDCMRLHDYDECTNQLRGAGTTSYAMLVTPSIMSKPS